MISQLMYSKDIYKLVQAKMIMKYKDPYEHLQHGNFVVEKKNPDFMSKL